MLLQFLWLIYLNVYTFLHLSYVKCKKCLSILINSSAVLFIAQVYSKKSNLRAVCINKVLPSKHLTTVGSACSLLISPRNNRLEGL